MYEALKFSEISEILIDNAADSAYNNDSHCERFKQVEEDAVSQNPFPVSGREQFSQNFRLQISRPNECHHFVISICYTQCTLFRSKKERRTL
jgi:hypothetical protein